MARVFKKDKDSPDWWIDYNDAHDRRRREKVGPNRSLALSVLGERLKEVTEETEFGIKKIEKALFNDFAREYIEIHAKPTKRSWKRDSEIIRLHLNPAFGEKYLTEITTQDIERFKAKRAARASDSTVNRELACLKTIFSKAIEWGKLERSPAAKVKSFRLNNGRLVFLETHECRNLIETCPKHLKPIVEVALLTGMRRGEIFSLKRPDIDHKTDVIHVLHTKSGRPRQIPLNKRLRQIFRSLPEHINSDLVFPSQKKGARWVDLKTSFKNAVERAGIKKHVTFHTLRHTFASHQVMAGTDLYTVSELLGHASIEMTQRYAHLSLDHKKTAMERLEDYLKAETKTA